MICLHVLWLDLQSEDIVLLYRCQLFRGETQALVLGIGISDSRSKGTAITGESLVNDRLGLRVVDRLNDLRDPEDTGENDSYHEYPREPIEDTALALR